MRRIGIVNRGEPAVRFLQAIDALRREEGDSAPDAVALYTDADAAALHVRRAELAVPLGAEGAGRAAWLDVDVVIGALQASGCDAAWLGWGFASEDAEFARALEAASITLLAPRPETMAALGDKISAKKLAEQHGVPVAPWAILETHFEADGSLSAGETARLRAAADGVGYPLLVKAAGGGGGRGIRRVDGPDELADAVHRAGDEAARSFRSAGLMLERCLEGARHVEVQILGDGEGTVRAVGLRDCSLQRRRQKVIEECQAPHLPAEIAETMLQSAVRLGEAVHYRSAGTVEFLYVPTTGMVAFLEVNTRLQVEHPVTEEVFGIDLVRWQIDLARGKRLPERFEPRGWAVEARLCAEDPRAGFAPAPGRIARLELPTGPGVRVDTGFAEGDRISAEFDPLVAKIIAWGPDRPAAFARLGRALDQTRIVVEGGRTNLDFLRGLLRLDAVRDGNVRVDLLDHLSIDAPPGEAEATIAAAIDRFLRVGDRRPDDTAERHEVDVGAALRVYRIGPARFRLTGEGGGLIAGWVEDDDHSGWLSLGARRVRVERAPGDTTYVVDGVPHRVAAGTAGAVVSPSVGLVLDVFVKPGDAVAAGQCVVILESMKMEVRVEATADGVVRSVRAAVGAQVRPGQWLLEVESETQVVATGPTLPLAPLGDTPHDGPDKAASRLRDVLLGWDAEAGQVAADLSALDGTGCVGLLNVYADLAEVFARRPRSRRGGAEGTADTLTPARAFETLRTGEVDALPAERREALARVLAHHDVAELRPSSALNAALLRLDRARARFGERIPFAATALVRLKRAPVALLDRLAALDPETFGAVVDAAVRARYRLFEAPAARRVAERGRALAGLLLARLSEGEADWAALAEAPEALLPALVPSAAAGSPLAAEAVARRLEWQQPEHTVAVARLVLHDGSAVDGHRVGGPEGPVVFVVAGQRVPALLAAAATLTTERLVVVAHTEPQRLASLSEAVTPHGPLPSGWGEVCFLYFSGDADPWVRRYRPDGVERAERRDILPTTARRFDLGRLSNFAVERLDRGGELVLIRATAHTNPDDVRLLAYGEVRSLHRLSGRPLHLPDVDRVFHQAVRAIQEAREVHDARRRLQWNRITLLLLPVVPLGTDAVRAYIGRLAPATERLGLEKVVVIARFADAAAPGGVTPWLELSIRDQGGPDRAVTVRPPPTTPMAPLSRYESRVVAARRRSLVHPYEIVAGLEGNAASPWGRFVELDRDAEGRWVRVDARPRGQNTAAVVLGVHTGLSDDPLESPGVRVVLLSDPTRGMGALAEAECRRILAGLDLAERLGVPLEWVAVSAGARIDWDTGTENLDWTARVLRRIIGFTQAGGEIDVLVPGVCVGAQAYWNAEATMMMHTRGLLVMTARGAMVLTGKRALDASGCVSAEDDLALGGYAAVMGPNGQAQAWADDLAGAWKLLLRYRRITRVPPGMGRPPWQRTADAIDRDLGQSPYPGEAVALSGAEAQHGFERVGDLFSMTHNPERKRPFAVRPVMAALVDADGDRVERWGAWLGAETAVVWETRVGGYATTLVGIDNQPVARLGQLAADGPTTFAGGTLYPQASRKVARALNAASGRRPVVVLANLSGFDGSPESLSRWQLEYGAEIGRAVVNFKGPILFVVLSRYHGGAYVVFSKALNAGLTAVALEGSHASVIGGAPAAAVVFAGEVRRQVQAAGGGAEAHARISAELATKFDGIHSVDRAKAVGSIDGILSVAALRPWVVARLAADHAQNAGVARPHGAHTLDADLAEALAALNAGG